MENIKIYGYEFTLNEDGTVSRTTKKQNGSMVPAYLYRYDRQLNSWIKQENVKPGTLRSGLKRGNWKIA